MTTRHLVPLPDPDDGYQPPEPACSICDDRRYFKLDVPVGHARYGAFVPCDCERVRQQSQMLATAQQGSLVPARFQTKTLETLTIPPGLLREAVRWRAGTATKPWLVLWGPSGTGKTSLAAALANAEIHDGRAVYFASVPLVLDQLRYGYSVPDGPNSFYGLYFKLVTIPVLILDEFDKTRPAKDGLYDWATEKLFALVNERYAEMRTTIFTMNRSPREIVPPEITSRLTDSEIGRSLRFRDHE